MPSINGVIDLRSDTLTLPTKEMINAMVSAPLGDDVWNEDPSVHELERYVANLAGKEAGLFVPSGTMSNIVATMTHCQISKSIGPSEIIIGDLSHLCSYEAGNTASIAGVFPRQLPTNKDGTIDISRIEAQIKEGRTLDPHFPITKMVALENTHNKCGGAVLPLEYCWQVRKMLDKYNNNNTNSSTNSSSVNNIGFHLDGARVWNACIALNKSLKEMCEPFHTVSLCLSKGLGAPIGSVLVGPKDFIALAKRFRKPLGGGMRQAGLLAAAGLYAIKNNFHRLKEDHDWAKKVGEQLQTRGGFEVLPVLTNIVIWKCPVPGKSAEFCEICEKKFKVRLCGMGADLCRAVPHLGNNHHDPSEMERVVKACIGTKQIMLSRSKL